ARTSSRLARGAARACGFLFRRTRAAVSACSGQRQGAARSSSPIPPEAPMKKAIVGLISLVALGAVLHFVPARQGADDPCGGCPKDFQCDLASLQCVPEDAHR